MASEGMAAAYVRVGNVFYVCVWLTSCDDLYRSSDTKSAILRMNDNISEKKKFLLCRDGQAHDGIIIDVSHASFNSRISDFVT